MDDYGSLRPTKWECKFIPKWRRMGLYGHLRPDLGEALRDLAAPKESHIVLRHLMPGHVHMLICIPPKYAVLQVVGHIKGKSAIHVARVYGERNFVGKHF